LVTSEDIEAVNGFIDPDGMLWAVPVNGDPPILVATPRGIHPDWLNVLRAAPMMYRTLKGTDEGYTKIIAYAEACDDQALTAIVLQLQAAVAVTLRCAIDGLENVAKNIAKDT
jgi:hypothetical protein